MYVSEQLSHRLALRSAAGNGGDFRPVAALFCFVHDHFDFHGFSSSTPSNPHRHHDVPVLKPVVAGIVGAHLAGGLGVFELQAHIAAV